MRRILLSCALALVLTGLSPGTGTATPRFPRAAAADSLRASRVRVADPLLHRILEELARASSRFARGLDSLRSGAFDVWVVTTAEYRDRTGERVDQPATVRIVYGRADSERVDSAFVVIDLEFLQAAYVGAGRSDALQVDLRLLLAHEIYGHLTPAASTGRRRDLCFDPGRLRRRLQRSARGCPTERENHIRADLGVPLRPSYGELGLAAEEVWAVLARVYAPLAPSVSAPRRAATR